MFQVGKGQILSPSENEIDALRCLYAENDGVALPGFIGSELATEMAAMLDGGEFYGKVHTGNGQKEFARDVTLNESHVSLHLLHFILNNSELFRIVEQITDCDSIRSFKGRIYSMSPADSHHIEWHNDGDLIGRMVGLSINLSRAPFAGGIFQLRESGSRKAKFEAESRNLGDAHIFRIAPNLQHRVTQVEGDSPRVAAAGWFFDNGGFLKNIISLRASSESRVDA